MARQQPVHAVSASPLQQGQPEFLHDGKGAPPEQLLFEGAAEGIGATVDCPRMKYTLKHRPREHDGHIQGRSYHRAITYAPEVTASSKEAVLTVGASK